MLRDSDRHLLYTLKEDVDRFYAQTLWDEDFTDLDLVPQVQLIFESTNAKGGSMVYQCQALFTLGDDQRFFDKSVQFPYNEGANLYFDPVLFDPLPGFLAFYAYVMLAGEMDTYDPLGGTSVYEKARNIAIRGANSDYSKGWQNRSDIVDEITSNFGYRRAKFAYYYARDLVLDGDIEEAMKQFADFFKGLKEAFNLAPRDRYTLQFLKAHAHDLTQMFVMLNQEEYLEELLSYDPDNEEIYLEGLEAISP